MTTTISAGGVAVAGQAVPDPPGTGTADVESAG